MLGRGGYIRLEIWQAIKDFIMYGLQFLYGITGDYGWAIILLTVVIRLALTPLTVKQTRSMYEMQRIQPKIKELQKKYKDDKEKLQEETLKFYQENKVNPFGGCLPIILQMPILLALFQVLQNEFPEYIAGLPTAAAQEAAKQFWIILPDLTASPAEVFSSSGWVTAIPYLTLVALFGLSIWLPQQLMPGEKQQKTTAMIMGVMFLYFGWNVPAGVLLYWVTSSLLGIVQQQATLKIYANKGDDEK